LNEAEAQIQINMAIQIPPDVKKFKVSIMSLVLCSIITCIIGIVVGFVVVAFQHGSIDFPRFWKILKIEMPLNLSGFVILTFYLYLVIIPTGISSDGIYARSLLGFRRHIRWADFAKIRKFTLLNLQYLLIYSSIDGKATSLPLFQARKKEFWDEIRKFVPPDSPILKFLN
jgi:ABC-type dipeptide/oligopeptide/nickel transport system permease component